MLVKLSVAIILFMQLNCFSSAAEEERNKPRRTTRGRARKQVEFQGIKKASLPDSIRMLKGGKKGKSGDTTIEKHESTGCKDVEVLITNLTYQQPFSPFFVMVHNGNVDPMFILGEQASPELQELAENGNPGKLIDSYVDVEGVLQAGSVGGPLFGGKTFSFTVPICDDYPHLTIASMAINTNDCFVALNGVLVSSGDLITGPGYDAGTEENNEKCSSIPGPGCPADSGNQADGKGEGYVHVHRGFFGIGGTLSAAGYDWRNPMIRIEIV